MTAEEFKILMPEYKNASGDELWNAMEDYMLRQQSGDEIIKQIMPIWKTHTFRYLIYRKLPNIIWETKSWKCIDRCDKCKKGFNMALTFFDRDEPYILCPNCMNECKKEPNENFSYKLYKFYKLISKIFWKLLEIIHLVRSDFHGRYDMFGDESRYVKNYEIDTNLMTTKYNLKKRKWWEYILIEKHTHNF